MLPVSEWACSPTVSAVELYQEPLELQSGLVKSFWIPRTLDGRIGHLTRQRRLMGIDGSFCLQYGPPFPEDIPCTCTCPHCGCGSSRCEYA